MASAKFSDQIKLFSLHVKFSLAFRKLFQRISEHCPRHMSALPLQEFFQGMLVFLPRFPQHPANSLVNEVMLIMHKFFSQFKGLVKLVPPDKSKCRNDSYSSFP